MSCFLALGRLALLVLYHSIMGELGQHNLPLAVFGLGIVLDDAVFPGARDSVAHLERFTWPVNI